jgi:hypothetical protein
MDPTLLCPYIVSLLCSVSVRITSLFKYYKPNFIKSIKAKRMSTTAALFDYVVEILVFFFKKNKRILLIKETFLGNTFLIDLFFLKKLILIKKLSLM